MEIEVGKITPKEFQYAVVVNMHTMLSYSEDDSTKYYVNLLSEKEIMVDVREQFVRTEEDGYKVECECRLTYSINYDDGLIKIDFLEWWVSDSSFKNRIDKESEAQMHILSIGVEKTLKAVKRRKLVNDYARVFNPVTCINMSTGDIESIRLTPNYTISKEVKIRDRWRWVGYDVFTNSYTMVQDKEGARLLCSDNDSCLYMFSNSLITRSVPGSDDDDDAEVWIPLATMLEGVPIELNKPLFVKNINKPESKNFWMYISTGGIVYDGRVLVSTMRYEDEEDSAKRFLVFKSAENTVKLLLAPSDTIEMHVEDGTTAEILNLAVEKTGDFHIIPPENDGWPSELSSSVHKYRLYDGYYDGTAFWPLATKYSEDILDSQEKHDEWVKAHPVKAVLSRLWDFITSHIIASIVILAIVLSLIFS